MFVSDVRYTDVNDSTVLDAGNGYDRVCSIKSHTADYREFSISPVQSLIEIIHS